MGKSPQQIAEENERRIVRFTNIDKEDFTHSFRGISISVDAGKSYTCRFPEGDHLATHLARKIIARAKKVAGADKDYKGTILYTDEEINELKQKIVTDLGSDAPKTLTPEEQRKTDIKGLEDKYPTAPPKKEKVTRAQVIKSLEERGIQVDINKSNDELLKQLMDAEAQGK